ncbi:pyroglutamyl-peptidase I [Halobacillus faecis]|uniref:Pyrrolidone-carboxylate peptidase n=1 Tax=Halobacillus faecis TaxID=360184 RepID=A0A511WW82_9BACI|nr:pyroglutamyl-peptidase I [Halobacillus faecis]GEN54581.1 pyrrolidone-carboxylate peptidase [Halobacillus faecis]
MKKLLLTGFEPFLDFPINPTTHIVEELKGKEMNGYQIEGRILPVDYNKSGQEILEHIQDVEPDAVISLGLAAGRYKMTPERIAINCNESNEKDNEGNTPEGDRIQKEGPDGLFSTLPIRRFVEDLQARGYPAEVSNTAGTYLCNHVMYQALYHFHENNLEVPSGFVHIPASHDLAVQHGKLPSWSQKDLTDAVKHIIQWLP